MIKRFRAFVGQNEFVIWRWVVAALLAWLAIEVHNTHREMPSLWDLERRVGDLNRTLTDVVKELELLRQR